MHDNDQTPAEQKVAEAKEFLQSLKDIDMEAHDQLLSDRFHDALDKTVTEYPEKKASYAEFLRSDPADMTYPELKRLHGLAAMFIAAMQIGRIKVKKPAECDEQGNKIASWCREIIEGHGGMNDYEYHEAVEWGLPERVAAAEWTLRCLANPLSVEAGEIIERILYARNQEEFDRKERLRQEEFNAAAEENTQITEGMDMFNDLQDDDEEITSCNSPTSYDEDEEKSS